MKTGGEVTAAFSPDGQRVVTVCADKTAQLWDAQTGKALLEQPMELWYCGTSAVFSPDGSRVLTASWNSVRVWDAKTGKPLTERIMLDGRASSAAFSPDGKRMVTTSYDNVAQVWDAQTGKPLGEPLRHPHSVLSASFSPDSSRLLTISSDKSARIWDVPFSDTGLPEWFLAMAERIGGFRLNSEGFLVRTDEYSTSRRKLRWTLDTLAPAETKTQVAGIMRWILADRSTRTVSPLSKLTVAEWIENIINDGTLDGLRAAIQVEPSDPRLAAHFGRALADHALKQETAADDARQSRGDADFQTRRALKLAPDNEEVKKLRAEVVRLLEIRPAASVLPDYTPASTPVPMEASAPRPAPKASAQLQDTPRPRSTPVYPTLSTKRSKPRSESTPVYPTKEDYNEARKQAYRRFDADWEARKEALKREKDYYEYQEDHSSGAAQEQWKYKKQGVEQRLDKIDDQKDAAKEELKHRWNDD
jgi:hypothetical protein